MVLKHKLVLSNIEQKSSNTYVYSGGSNFDMRTGISECFSIVFLVGTVVVGILSDTESEKLDQSDEIGL